VTVDRARAFAENWCADFCHAGELGHINSDSWLGFWPQGLLMLGQLLAHVNP
jgi:predicted alpha/beta hydrolase family esterase